MKRSLYIVACIALLPVVGSCGKEFLERYPHGQWYAENFTAEEVPYKILIEGELANAYVYQHSYDFNASAPCLHCISVCPQGARSLDQKVRDNIHGMLSKICPERNINKLFI